MKTPKIIKPHVLSFCRQVCKGDPFFVPLRPLPNKSVNDCVNIVPEQIAQQGGKQIIGWAIWEWPKVFIEAEFHTIWEAPGGELIDITPKAKIFDRILFLPDPKIKYRGRQIDNIRKPLTRNYDIERFIWLAEQRTIEWNKGDLADYYGPITPEGRLLDLQQEMMQLQRKLTMKYGPP